MNTVYIGKFIIMPQITWTDIFSILLESSPLWAHGDTQDKCHVRSTYIRSFVDQYVLSVKNGTV
jgi:hypothetical protein